MKNETKWDVAHLCIRCIQLRFVCVLHVCRYVSMTKLWQLGHWPTTSKFLCCQCEFHSRYNTTHLYLNQDGSEGKLYAQGSHMYPDCFNCILSIMCTSWSLVSVLARMPSTYIHRDSCTHLVGVWGWGGYLHVVMLWTLTNADRLVLERD